MKKLKINQNLIPPGTLPELPLLCPFGAIDVNDQGVEINAACRMCGLCVKTGPPGVFIIQDHSEDRSVSHEKSDWKGIAVYIDQVEGEFHPVGFELIGKARELARKSGFKVYALCIGHGIRENAEEILLYGVDEVFVYEQPEFEHFRIEPYAAAFEDFIREVKPSVCLVGGTIIGRSLAPRMAARFLTGLTADCTALDIKTNTDLDQIRPAFGGNIMAHIHTPSHRPQFATVRYKIFNAPDKIPPSQVSGKLHTRRLPEEKTASRIRFLEIKPKPRETGIEEAEVIVVAGRGVKKRADLVILQELADRLGGQLAATRSLIEAGWVDPRKQIGLSGRTVKPRLIITCGVSGAIQFVAGMNSSELIIAINTDKNAPIMKTAHIAMVGDLYQIIPGLLKQMEIESGPARS
jgi:electron transfer flavoprotein alpha subunit